MMERIGIIGDVHAQDDKLRQALRQLEKLGVDQIVCTGDLPDGTGDLEESCRLLQKEHVLTVREITIAGFLMGSSGTLRKPTRENRWTTIRYNF